jgi:hypothetical protein
MSAYGRKRPLISAFFEQFERPLSGNADVQELAVPKSIWNSRFLTRLEWRE